MRIMAMILNLIAVGFLLYLVIPVYMKGMMGWDNIAGASLMFLFVIINLIALYLCKGESWAALYFKRKALEEKAKIKQLREKES